MPSSSPQEQPALDQQVGESVKQEDAAADAAPDDDGDDEAPSGSVGGCCDEGDDDDEDDGERQAVGGEGRTNSNNNNRKRPAASSEAPITPDGERPQKKFYRQRAHCNPLSHNDSFDYPVSPDLVDWTVDHYPGLKPGGDDDDNKNNSDDIPPVIRPNVLDVGCGFGGLTLALASLLPSSDNVILGLEIRAKVTEYVRLRIANARRESPDGILYQNCSVLRTNSMKFLVNYFAKSSIDKLFFCFPDPHFKRKNHTRRIVSRRLLSEYAYVLKPGVGRLYCITDVEELHDWHVRECDAHPLFRRLPRDQIENDPRVEAMKTETEEGKKVSRSGGTKYYAVYERIFDNDAPQVHSDNFFS